MYIYLILHVYNVHNSYTCNVWKELPPVNLAVAICDSCSGMTSKLIPGFFTVCNIGASTAQSVKITGVCGLCLSRQEVISGSEQSATLGRPTAKFFAPYCNRMDAGLMLLNVSENYHCPWETGLKSSNLLSLIVLGIQINIDVTSGHLQWFCLLKQANAKVFVHNFPEVPFCRISVKLVVRILILACDSAGLVIVCPTISI